jgi:hypothetical protein
MGGGFVDWDRFGNVFPDESDEVPANDGNVSVKTFGGFFGPGVQSDTGFFQTVEAPDAAGKTFRATISTLSPSTDPLQPLDFDDPDGDGSFGHLPLLLLQFADANGDTIEQPEVRVFDPTVDPLDTWLTFSTEGVAPPGTVQVTVFGLLIQFGDDPGSLFWDSAVLEEVQGGCNAADLAEPFGVLDLTDITAFIDAFTGQTPAGDINQDGFFDLSDINAFATAFSAGCP